MNFSLEELAEFLVEAKTHTYAGDGKEIAPQRPRFKELEFIKGDWNYRDSYVGFFYAPGQEVARFREVPVWAMSYSGGMRPKYHGQKDFAKETFAFLKKALSKVDKTHPFRGPRYFCDGEWTYETSHAGDITDFSGIEHIYQRTRKFSGNFISAD